MEVSVFRQTVKNYVLRNVSPRFKHLLTYLSKISYALDIPMVSLSSLYKRRTKSLINNYNQHDMAIKQTADLFKWAVGSFILLTGSWSENDCATLSPIQKFDERFVLYHGSC